MVIKKIKIQKRQLPKITVRIRCEICNTVYWSNANSCPKCKYPVYTLNRNMKSIKTALNEYRKKAAIPEKKKVVSKNAILSSNNIQSIPKSAENKNTGNTVVVSTDVKPSVTPSKNIQAGQLYKMGKYRDEEISWRVLCVKNGKALLISEKVLDKKLFDEDKKKGIIWEKCTLRNWLNNAFYNFSFTQQEKKKIVLNTLRYRDSREVKDFVFLLSIDEANKYFLDDEDRKATPTEYVKNNIKPDNWYESSTHRPWWLRSPSSYDSYSASFVSSSGKVNEYDLNVFNHNIYIRPAMWIYI